MKPKLWCAHPGVLLRSGHQFAVATGICHLVSLGVWRRRGGTSSVSRFSGRPCKIVEASPLMQPALQDAGCHVSDSSTCMAVDGDGSSVHPVTGCDLGGGGAGLALHR